MSITILHVRLAPGLHVTREQVEAALNRKATR